MSLQKQYDVYQKSDAKIKMEEEIASKREKLEELKLSLKNTKVISFRIELLARLGLIESSILSKDLLKC